MREEYVEPGTDPTMKIVLFSIGANFVVRVFRGVLVGVDENPLHMNFSLSTITVYWFSERSEECVTEKLDRRAETASRGLICQLIRRNKEHVEEKVEYR